jgi:hypothetical protein
MEPPISDRLKRLARRTMREDRPETQTFVSTTTRRARPPHLSNGSSDVSLDHPGGGSRRIDGARPTRQQGAVTTEPFVLAENLHALGSEPLVDG